MADSPRMQPKRTARWSYLAVKEEEDYLEFVEVVRMSPTGDDPHLTVISLEFCYVLLVFVLSD